MDLDWSIIGLFSMLVLVILVLLLTEFLRTVLSCKWTVGMSMCRLIVSSSVLCHASLNSRAYFVCARPNNCVFAQLKV